MRSRHTKHPSGAGPAVLVGLDVEVRTAGGGVIRGRLEAVGGGWVEVERPNGRRAFTPLLAVTAIEDSAARAVCA